MLEWSHIYEGEIGARAFTVLVHRNGSYTLAGYSRVDNSNAGYLINVDAGGLVNWETSIVGAEGEEIQIYDTSLNSLDQIVFVGRGDGYNPCIGILSEEGVLINLEVGYGSLGISGRLSDIKILENNNIFSAGKYEAALLNENLESIWTHSVNHGSGTWSVEGDNDGNYYGVGSGHISNEGFYAFIFKLSDTESIASLIVNEIMTDPSSVPDNNGEWFELYNSTISEINMSGWSLNDNSGESITLDASAVVNPHAYYVLGKNSTPATNGGVYIDYQYTDFFLNNSSDAIIIKDQFGVTIDSVGWSPNQPLPSQSGVSAALTNWQLDNSLMQNWEPSIYPYGDGDLGTPGGPNHFPFIETEGELFFNNTMVGTVDTIFIDVYNTGHDTLIINSIFSLNANIVPLSTTLSVDPSAVACVPITFSPQSEGSLESELWIFSNSYQSTEYAIGVCANAIAPGAEISFATDTLQFIIDDVDGSISKYLHYQNTGLLPLTFLRLELSNSLNDFTVETIPQVLDAGMEDSISIRLDANASTVEDLCELIIESNDPITPVKTIILEVANSVTAISQSPPRPDRIHLDQNFPNPFNPSTTIRYGLPEDSNVSLVIYDVLGNNVQTLESGHQPAGWYDVVWNGEMANGSPISTGIYFARLIAGDHTQVVKMLFLK